MVATEIDAAAVRSLNENGPVPLRLRLELEVTDPEVVVELTRHVRGPDRDRFAAQALRIGVLSARMATGQIDAAAIQASGDKLIGGVREALAGAATSMVAEVQRTLGAYLDPDNGAFEQRVRSLVAGDGELARLLDAHLGGGSSVLARTLAGSLGEGSELFRLLSPSDTAGVRAQLQGLLEDMLGRQREAVLREFSLDAKDSALNRLIERLGVQQGELEHGFRLQAGTLLAELSLDQPDSAMNRLVKKVEAAQATLSGEFSLDNRDSALSRMALTIHERFEALARKNDSFHTEVREAIAGLKATREEADRSTRHGGAFEDALGQLLGRLSQRRGDVLEATGASVGLIKNCKIGDHVIELGPDARAPGAKIVWEAKEERGYTLAKARAEIESARRNRGAQLGVFVFSSRAAPAGLEPLARYGEDFVVVWDADDAASDQVVRLAYLAAVALASAERQDDAEVLAAIEDIERAARAIDKQLGGCEEMRRAAEAIKAQAEKIEERARKMRIELERQVAVLDEQIAAFRQPTAAG